MGATNATPTSTVAQAESLAACRYEQFLSSKNQTLTSHSVTASGTLTINNGDNIKAIYLWWPPQSWRAPMLRILSTLYCERLLSIKKSFNTTSQLPSSIPWERPSQGTCCAVAVR